jgi:predicted regulator of Ras-like GTPase activity (Roadblock/LC7/MglB family)
MDNPQIEALLVADTQGRILRSSRELSSDDERVASMLQSMEVLAQSLAAEFACGKAQLVQLSTSEHHIILLPLIRSAYFLVVQTRRSAPLTLLMIEIERVIQRLRQDDLVVMQAPLRELPDEVALDAAELIEAVREWLQNRPSRGR